MFEALTAKAPDAIMHLMALCKADTNPNKIDLGVGVYKTEDGATPIMRAVKKAEQLWWAEEDTKTYVGTVGNAAFRKSMLELIFGSKIAEDYGPRLASAQAAGGSGALRLGAELIVAANPKASVWVSTPTWANHIPLISSAGLKMESYPYYNRDTLGVDFSDMLACLKAGAKPGDIVLLHGCCHNPTGADFSRSEWDELAKFLLAHGLIPFVDLAYFGLGRGMDDDTYGLRKLMTSVDELILAASCSKNFALYRERVGLVAVLTKDVDSAINAQTQFGALQRKIISMPPDHGAALVARILTDEKLRAEWTAELDEMRGRMRSLRVQLSGALNVQGGEVMSAAVKNQNGMFSTLPLSKAQAEALRETHSVYLTNSGRINIAGTNTENIPRLADAILKVL